MRDGPGHSALKRVALWGFNVGVFFHRAILRWRGQAPYSYDSRPGMCRDYPRALLYQPNPEFLPGCGYRAVGRDAQGSSGPSPAGG